MNLFPRTNFSWICSNMSWDDWLNSWYLTAMKHDYFIALRGWICWPSIRAEYVGLWTFKKTHRIGCVPTWSWSNIPAYARNNTRIQINFRHDEEWSSSISKTYGPTQRQVAASFIASRCLSYLPITYSNIRLVNQKIDTRRNTFE